MLQTGTGEMQQPERARRGRSAVPRPRRRGGRRPLSPRRSRLPPRRRLPAADGRRPKETNAARGFRQAVPQLDSARRPKLRPQIRDAPLGRIQADALGTRRRRPQETAQRGTEEAKAGVLRRPEHGDEGKGRRQRSRQQKDDPRQELRENRQEPRTIFQTIRWKKKKKQTSPSRNLNVRISHVVFFSITKDGASIRTSQS